MRRLILQRVLRLEAFREQGGDLVHNRSGLLLLLLLLPFLN